MRLTKSLAACAGALLVAFHGWLLASQFVAGRLSEPWVVVRWILAAGLIASLVAIRRQGASIVGRKSVAIWVLAALLHGPAIASDFGGALNAPSLPEVVATIALQVVVRSTVLALGLCILAGLFARRQLALRRLSAPVFAFATSGNPSASRPPQFSPRPPPRK